jgi:hypothetical protein
MESPPHPVSGHFLHPSAHPHTPVHLLCPGPCFLANTQLRSVNCNFETIHSLETIRSLEKLQTFLSLCIKGIICTLLCHHAQCLWVSRNTSFLLLRRTIPCVHTPQGLLYLSNFCLGMVFHEFNFLRQIFFCIVKTGHKIPSSCVTLPCSEIWGKCHHAWV